LAIRLTAENFYSKPKAKLSLWHFNRHAFRRSRYSRR